jgi:hypothetical protein
VSGALTLLVAAVVAYATLRSSDAAEIQAKLATVEQQQHIQQAAQDEITKAANAISFSRPPGTITRCVASLTGQAEMIPGEVLWLAQKAVRGNSGYFFRKATHTSDGWTVTRWTIGGPDSASQQYEITAFYVGLGMSTFLDSLAGQSTTDQNVSWSASVLPPGYTSSKNLVVQRGPEVKQPSCAGTI